jgi:hypothetical protein
MKMMIVMMNSLALRDSACANRQTRCFLKANKQVSLRGAPHYKQVHSEALNARQAYGTWRSHTLVWGLRSSQ